MRSVGRINLNQRGLLLAFLRFALGGLDFDLVRGVARYEASVSAAIDVILFAQVVGIEQAFSDARNADKKAVWMVCLCLALAQCCIPSRAFHDGNRPGTLSVSSKRRGAGVWEQSAELVLIHGKGLRAPSGDSREGRWFSCDLMIASDLAHSAQQLDALRPLSALHRFTLRAA